MKVILFIFFLFLIFSQVSAADNPEQKYILVKGDSYVQSKNYYFLTLLQQLPEVKNLIVNDPEFSKIALEKKKILTGKLKECGDRVPCFLESLIFNSNEIQIIGGKLVELYGSSKEMKMVVNKHLIPSGCYNIYANLEPKEILRKAWEQDAKAVNHALKIYIGGEKANYPAIDSVSLDKRWKYYPNLIDFISTTVTDDLKKNGLFFSPTLTYALRALELNERNRAADYEPMTSKCNKAAYDRIKSIKWADYKYSVILVPGEGPEIYDQAISPIGMLRCRSAASRWKEGLAPFIMVSGGKVHPFKTKYSEAEEMKRYLMEGLQIPENVILMEPHARHTSTNLRNCARMVFRYGIPMDKPCLSSSNKEQSYYMSSKSMQDRCMEELGYLPYKNGNRLSETVAEFYPLVTSLQIDFDEPLDP
jgi:DUF218 domain